VRAAYIDKPGPAADIRYGEVPEPVPGPTDVLVEVIATTANPVDTFVRSGAYPVPMTYPFVIGRDAVGRVLRAGPGAAGFAAGELVWTNSLGHGGRQGAAAERAVVPGDRLYHLPDGVRPHDAVTVLHPAGTAYLGLFPHGRLRAGETVLVAGAGGNVGGALVTLAVDAGARVIATASARDAGHCADSGAAAVLDYRDPALADRIATAAPDGVDVWLDTSGRNELSDAVRLLADRGRIVLLAGATSRPVLPAGALYLKSGSVRGFVISTATVTELAHSARTTNRLLASGRLRSRATEVLPLSETAEVHRRLEAGELHGRRVILHVSGEGTS
jgi:NADPH:quinone reductase-like Zn-dependent oxidoreductase